MAKYKSIVVTNGGLALVAAAHSGDTIEFTAIKTGAGVYDGTEVLAEATDLKDLKQTMSITGITKDENVVKIRTVLSNEGVADAYSITEIGLYAKDSTGNEILYAIVIAEESKADYLPAYADAPTTITMELYIDATSYESGVTFQATVIAGTYATVEDLNDAVNTVMSSVASRIGTAESSMKQYTDTQLLSKVNTTDIVNNLSSTAADLPLSANMGKTLNESISGINTEVAKKVNTADIVNNLTSTETAKPLSANQGKVLNEKVNIELAKKVNTADIVDSLTSTSTDKPLSANQGKVLNENIAGVNTEVSKKINTTDIVDNLTSTATNKPLSANQGKVLNEKINTELAKKVNTTDIVDSLESTNSNVPLSANQGRVLNASITNANTEIAKKVNAADIVDSLTSTATNVPLSANQGKVLNANIDSKVSAMQSSILQTVNTELAKKVNTTDIVDGLTSTATNVPLSANQGKVLNASITNANTEIAKKVNTADIVNSLTSTATNVPLSANQGRVLNANIDNKVSTMQSSILQTVNTELAKKVNTADIVDNLESTATNVPLSANQGKVLNDGIATINNTINRTTAYHIINYNDGNGITQDLSYFKGKCPLIFIGVTYGVTVTDRAIIPSDIPQNATVTTNYIKLVEATTNTTAEIHFDWSNYTLTANWSGSHSEKANVYVHIWGIHSSI